MSPLLIAIAAFIAVAALVGGVALAFREPTTNRVEERLDMFTGRGAPAAGDPKQRSLLTQPFDDGPGMLEALLARVSNININLLFEQADTTMTVGRLGLVSGVLGGAGLAIGAMTGMNLLFVPPLAGVLAALPLLWLFWRRKRRMKAFSVQLPDALEMLGRALRAGQSLQAGMNMVSHEMALPLGKEFGRVFEEQNLGVPLEEALENMTRRVPNLDLRFFVTAVILQRQTGGDLAEILDKIGGLIRERFQIWGQIQALTGEGRLSGVVLMALPLVLFLAVYRLNPEYIMLLFTDPLGKKLLAGAIVLQVLGALVIRKIVNIKV